MQESPKKYDVEENTGEYTKAILEDKIYSFDFEANEASEMLKDSEIEHKFSDALKSFIIECGYKVSDDENNTSVLEMKKYICRKLSDIGEENAVSEKSVGRWLKGENRPDYTPKSRESMFVLMFAMGANLMQTYNFFLKAYYAQPFNFRNQSECVYYWALKNERNWEFVKAIKLKIQEAQANVKEINVFDDKTILIGKALDELVTEEELVSYISNNISPDETYFTTAKNVFNDLLYEAKALAGIKYDELQAEINAEKDKNKILAHSDDSNLAENDYLDNLAYRCQRDSVDFLLSVIFYSRVKIKPDKSWNLRIKENFPNKEQLSRCYNGEVSNVDLLRKCMILLMFYIIYGNNNDCDFDEFYSNVNYQLDQCGFPLLYPANPYDRIFLTCVFYGTSTDDFSPMDCFTSVFDTED